MPKIERGKRLEGERNDSLVKAGINLLTLPIEAIKLPNASWSPVLGAESWSVRKVRQESLHLSSSPPFFLALLSSCSLFLSSCLFLFPSCLPFSLHPFLPSHFLSFLPSSSLFLSLFPPLFSLFYVLSPSFPIPPPSLSLIPSSSFFPSPFLSSSLSLQLLGLNLSYPFFASFPAFGSICVEACKPRLSMTQLKEPNWQIKGMDLVPLWGERPEFSTLGILLTLQQDGP